MKVEKRVNKLEQTQALAAAVATCLPDNLYIALNGSLGAGKTTFCQYLLKSLGYNGTVKSPTFTMVEEYRLPNKLLFHFDLYRIQDVEELELMGIRDYFQESAIILIEWAEKGKGLLPVPDINCTIRKHGEERLLTLQSHSEVGQKMIKQLP